jgi:heme-degrading monooxygenase HmoA
VWADARQREFAVRAAERHSRIRGAIGEAMVTEIAQIDVTPGTETEFEAGVAKARELFGRARGFKSLALHRSIEKPQRYRLVIEWETLENHTVDFYGKDDWKAWRALVAHCFAGAPQVEHTSTVLTG